MRKPTGEVGVKTMDAITEPASVLRHRVTAAEESGEGPGSLEEEPVAAASEEESDEKTSRELERTDSVEFDTEGELGEREESEVEEDDDGASVHSDASLVAASLRRIQETVAGIGERMSRIETQLEEKMARIGEKVAELESRLNEKAGELEAHIKDKVEKTKANIERVSHWAWTALPFDKLPQWLQDNQYLTAQHRPPMNSFLGCTKSLFRMHTETWNIWTHLLGCAFFLVLCLGIYVYGDYITFLFEDIEIYQLPATEQAMLFCFLLAAMICLSCSALFHLFSNHSQTVYRLFSRLDYSGIAILITGSSIPAYYYGFYCSSIAQCTHMSITSVLGLGCIILSLWEKFAAHEYRPLRFTTFVLFGIYGAVPTVHVVLREGLEKQHVLDAGRGIVLMACLYLFGAVLYVFQFPERAFPGKFNTWASSHQLFHVCVVCAAVVHYDTLLSMIKYRMSFDSCAHELVNSLPGGGLT